MLYIHIPFCVYKCAYCNFYSVVNMNSPDLYKKYLDALIKELEIRIKDYKKNIETIYIGGGTPSIIGAKMLETARLFINWVRINGVRKNTSPIT